MLEDLVPTSLSLKKVLSTPGEPVDAVYFPADCVVSLLVSTAEGEKIEVATIGNEGAVGVYSALAGRAVAINMVQSPGEALRLSIAKFNQYRRTCPAFESLMFRYLFVLSFQTLQAGACNQLHSVNERCARWLLMMHDWAGADEFEVTQEFLAEMLAVRRATVNLSVSILKNAGLITYTRGHLTVLDRKGLYSVACSCYGLIRREYESLGVM
jgi:CRP-like cAMP-binding protein